MRTYRQLFSVREFVVLFVLRCTVLVTVSMSGLALGTITYDRTGSTLLTALAMFGGPLVTLVGSTLVLGLSDTLRPRTALAAQILAATVTSALQALPGLPWPVRFVLLALPYAVASATSGVNLRLLAAVLPAEAFLLGRSTLNIAVGLMQVVGYATGGLLLQWSGPTRLFQIAALAGAASLLLCRFGIGDHPTGTASGRLMRRTRSVNRALLGSPVLRPVLLSLWLPNGLIVGCEALFVPYGAGAGGGVPGLLFAAAAGGMLLGDVTVGRFVPPALRDRFLTPLRLLLALPYLVFVLHPPAAVGPALAFLASAGYSASLVLQERVHRHADPAVRGQAFGLAGNGMMIGQSVGAVAGGAVATLTSPATAMGLLATASITITLALSPGLRRSALRVSRASRHGPPHDATPARR